LTSGEPAKPTLIGRESELKELERLLNLAIQSKGHTVLVSGEAGVGKSRLTNEFLVKAKKKGTIILAGWCLSDAAVPYFPFVEAFNTYFSSSFDDQPLGFGDIGNSTGFSLTSPNVGFDRGITAWLTTQKYTSKIANQQILSPQVWKDQIFAGVSATLHEISMNTPVILFIEDLHWADSASLSLLHYLSRVVNDSEKILILGTYRTEGLTVDQEGHMHPLSEEMRLMSREDLFSEIKLEGLSRPQIETVAQNMLGGGQLEERLIEKLEHESHGNSLFVTESIKMLQERKNIALEEGVWRLAVNAIGIPSKIRDIIIQRIAPLNFKQRRVLDASAVIGEKFNLELLSAVLNQDSLEVLEYLDDIMHVTSVLLVDNESYRFDHARSREIIYDDISLPLKRGYHARVAQKLEIENADRPPLSDLAYHYARAGDKEKCLKYSLAAAKDELAHFSNQQAIEHFKYVLENDAENSAEKTIAAEGLGDAYYANSMYDEAMKTFDGLAKSEDGRLRLRAIRKAMDALFLKGNQPALLLEYAKKAEALADCDRLEMARVINNRSRAYGWAGEGDATLDLKDSETALRIFEEENSISDMGDALWRCGVVSTMYDELRPEGLAQLIRSISIFRETGDVRKEIEATIYAGTGFRLSCLFNEAQSYYRRVLDIAKNLGVFTALAQACMAIGLDFEQQKRDYQQAIAYEMKALEYSNRTDVAYIKATITARLVRQYAIQGDIENSTRFMNQLQTFSMEETGNKMSVNSQIQSAKFAYALAKGEKLPIDKVFKGYIEASQKTMEFGHFPSLEVEARTYYSRCLDWTGRVEEANAQRQIIKDVIKRAEERFTHSFLKASLVSPRKLMVGEQTQLWIDLVNVSRAKSSLSAIQNVVPAEFDIISINRGSLESNSISFSDLTIQPFGIERIKLTFKPTQAGVYDVAPNISYIDDLNQLKTVAAKPITITVSEPQAQAPQEAIPGKVSTGYSPLDRLLLGGIPAKQTVILAMSSSDERQLILRGFLEKGFELDETTIYITCDNANIPKQIENTLTIICNNQAESVFKDKPSLVFLKSIENLTEIDITLTKFLRTLDPSSLSNRRICIDILSDVLLQHKAVTSRKWLSSLLVNLKANGFTTLAVIDPKMHRSEDLQAILSLFDGEITVLEKESLEGIKRTLRINKLYNENYLKEEITLERH
jgi:KaiC/GvpD/RAD55 family RecA-like ATPase/tetratricopeptide (TPR) repeat protein